MALKLYFQSMLSTSLSFPCSCNIPCIIGMISVRKCSRNYLVYLIWTILICYEESLASTGYLVDLLIVFCPKKIKLLLHELFLADDKGSLALVIFGGVNDRNWVFRRLLRTFKSIDLVQGRVKAISVACDLLDVELSFV